MRITPLDFAQAEDFISALTDEERIFLDDLTAGYTLKEISRRNHIKYSRLPLLAHPPKKKPLPTSDGKKKSAFALFFTVSRKRTRKYGTQIWFHLK